VAYVVNLVVRQCANALGRPQYSSWGQIVALVLTVAGLPLVLPRFGIAGAAVISSVAYVTRLTITMTLLRKVGVTGTTPGPDDVRWLVRRLMSRLTNLRRHG
jgi:O-antigen/teichoic acid export membrane protein